MVDRSSEQTRSRGGMWDLAACPTLERAPLMHWIAERSREKVIRLRSQLSMVECLTVRVVPLGG